MNSEFEFTVHKDDDGKYRVRLPHQCDMWDIAGEEYGPGASFKEAVEKLEKFIAEANNALLELKNYE